MGASFSFELQKAIRRPAVWVLGLIFLAAVALFGYLLGYVFIVGVEGDPPPEARQFLSSLYPENLLASVLGLFGGFGVAISLVLGALVIGSEYGWDTLKLSLTQGPGRLALFGGKLLAVAAVLAVFTVLAFAVGTVASYAVAAVEDAPVEWPALADTLKALGAGWLILAVFAAMGLFLATLFRGSALAIGLGLVYLLVLENLFLGFSPQNETVESVGEALPARNSLDLSASFGEETGGAGTLPPGLEAVGANQATLVLLAYLAGFLVLAALLFRRRDVT